MTTEASSPEPENKERNKDDERRRVALVLLFLLLSFICIFCSSQGALFFIDRDQIAGHMRSALQADYGLEAPVEFPRVLIDSIVPEIIGDNFDLEATPVIVSAGSIAVLPQPVAQITSTPTPVPPIPTLTPTSTPSPTPVPPTSAPPEDTPEPPPPPPSPTLEPTLPPPSPTSLPPSPTIPPPAPTISLPSPTSPPPTSPPPTSPPATSPPPTSPPSTPVPNNPPVAVDDVATTNEDVATFPINVLANDSDSDGMLVPGSVTVTSGPANGATSVNATTGEITYTPNLNFNGIDTFTYQVCDDDGACDTATVTVTVNSVNDPPVANDDIGTVNQDTPTTINVATNDTDVDGNLDPTSVITVTNPLSGTTALGPGAGEITYTPNAGISGVDTFSYQICDVAPPTPAPLCDTALVTITITDTVPLPPTNLRAAPGNMQISLGWDHTPEPDLLGYRVYRSDNGGPYSLISTTMVITKYSDFSPPLNNGFTYAYTVTAIDAASNESGPSNIASAIPLGIITFTNSVTCGGITFTNCIEAGGPPDNVSAAISMTGVITFDFGAGQGIIDGPGYDMVFYELYRSISMGIRLDFTRIELSTDGATWFTVFEWDGDDPGDIVGTNIDSYANDFNGEQEDEPIPEADLYPGGAGSHGVAIDIGVSAPSGNLYRFVRITDPGSSSGPQKHTDIDAIERLN